MKKKVPSEEELKKLGVFEGWGIWTKEKSEFDWSYDDTETCYIIEGEVEVTADNGEKIEFTKGDLVQFPKGLKCKWNVKSPVRKHYNFGDLDIDNI